MNNELKQVRKRGCQCGDDEACAFVRERDAAREQVARLEADRQAAFKVGYQLTLDCQSLEEMTTTLVALCRTARADRDAMELARIADVADHCAAVQQRDAAQARVRELEAALREHEYDADPEVRP